MSPRSKPRGEATVLVQVRISRRAARLLRERAASVVRSQASYLRAIIYRDLGLVSTKE